MGLPLKPVPELRFLAAATCSPTAECAEGFACDASQCRKKCSATSACAFDENCQNNICKPDDNFEIFLKGLKVSGDIVFRPQDASAGNYLLPAVNGNHRQFLVGRFRDSFFHVLVETELQFQTPPGVAKTKEEAASRVLLSGGDGLFGTQIKAAIGKPNLGAGVSLGGTVAWSTPSVTGDSGPVAETFGMARGAVTLQAWAEVFYLGAQFAGATSFGEKTDVAQTIDGALTITALMGLGLRFSEKDGDRPDMFLQARLVKALFRPDTPASFEVRLVTSFKPL